VIQIQDFSLLTLTWGPVYLALGVPPGNIGPIFGVYLRPDTTRAILYQNSALNVLFCGILDATNTWVTSFSVVTNAPAGFTADGFAVMDPTGRLHVFFGSFAVGGPQCYQAIEPNNTLGQFNQLNLLNTLYWGTPAVVGDSIIVPTTEGPFPGPPPSFNPVSCTVWFGSPLAAPVWQQSDAVFPNADVGLNQLAYQDFLSAPMLVYDGVALYALAILSNRAGSTDYLIELSRNNGPDFSTGWTDWLLYQPPNTSPLFGTLIRPSFTVIPGNPLNVLFASDANDSNGNEVGYSFAPVALRNQQGGGGGAAGLGAAGGLAAGGRGAGAGLLSGPTRFICCSKGHEIQAAQQAEALRRKVNRRQQWPYIQEFPPPGSIPVQQIADIVSPAQGVLSVILAYLVPKGFKFYLCEVLNDFGGGPVNPGDALWTIDQNAPLPNVQGSPVQGLTGVPIPLGSLLTGEKWPMPSTYEFAPLTLLRSTVVNLNLTPGLPNYFTSGLFGFLFPAKTLARIID
jgi:hypothetical protein